MKTRALQFPRADAAPPPDRGELLTADEVASKLLRGEVKPAWVRQHVPHAIKLGRRTVFWYEQDVRRWLESQRTTEVA